MKIQFLGTAAAEGYPAVFCSCKSCERARAEGGKNIRTRSQAIVDDKILIDFPADTYMHSLMYNVPLRDIKTCLITHNHSDHLYAEEALMRYGAFAHLKEENTLNFFGTAPSMAAVQNEINMFRGINRVAANVIEPFTPFEAEGYKITALKARHNKYCAPVFYLIEKDGKTLLYAHDTGLFFEETYRYIEENVTHIDFATFDCCGNETHIMEGHMNTENVCIPKERLEKTGIIDGKTICFVNHFSHNIDRTHAMLEEEMNKKGFLVSYDGLSVEF